MLEQGALHADANEIEVLVESYVNLLNTAKDVHIVKDGYELTFSVENRSGIRSTGMYAILENMVIFHQVNPILLLLKHLQMVRF
ncbi:hypothetical protein ABFY60_00875 [Lysinibacillus pakistanensis]|uniref:hypothetical protein n=1 Tax=Lysinibacillus pakistanensis TaxID=759811 RepID=UPI003D27FD5B